MIQDLTLPKSKVPLRVTQLNSEAQKEAPSPYRNHHLEASAASAFATSMSAGIRTAPHTRVLVGAEGVAGQRMWKKTGPVHATLRLSNWMEEVASARDKTAILGLHNRERGLTVHGSNSRYFGQPSAEVN